LVSQEQTFHVFWWFQVSSPLKNISQLGLLFPIYGKMKNVPNHQPVPYFLVVFSIVISLQISAQLPSSGPESSCSFNNYRLRGIKNGTEEIPQSRFSQEISRNHLEKEDFAASCGSGKQQSSWLQCVSR
jgi:hypothetical protein